ncbi:MAG TPA: dUTP diphosphatase, partial [Bacilli bacterium]|nr:dUTP diphosphatase [Bacilli bacterium]HQB80329.1 dUTP diphosphatase [Bacilli bacterium]
MNRGFMLIKDELLTYKEEDTLIPKRATKYSAGYDFYLPCDVVLKAKKKVQVKTNLKAYMK